MATVPLITDESVGDPRVAAVFSDIRATRGTDNINNFWRALANDPPLLEATWARLKMVMGPGALNPLTKELLYLAVSMANSCDYCIHSHTTAARAKGMTDAQHGELLAILAMASQTNALATALAVPVDQAFNADPN
ncbi:MAG: carboxymuconolactone decarboxylase family protein [Pseudomonadota bacterium]